MSHLWQSMAHESAVLNPASSGAYCGDMPRPEAERAVDVDPGVGIASAGADFLGGIECAGVDVAGLNAEQRAAIEGGKRSGRMRPC